MIGNMFPPSAIYSLIPKLSVIQYKHAKMNDLPKTVDSRVILVTIVIVKQ